jgi:uncharacterized OB-fold protein
MATLSPIAADLWTDEPQPRLIGGRHRTTGRIVFPLPPGDAAADYDALALSRHGSLWSWTVQSFRPKSPPYDGPEAFEPFALGYVELPGEVIVEARLTVAKDLIIGMPVELVIIPFDATRATFAFRPQEDRT